METLKTKVCIIGSGISGSLCAKYLAPKFDDILIVERGAKMTHEQRLQTKEQEIPISTAIHRDVVMGEFPDKRLQYVYALGGTTNHWMGQTLRLLPNDFRMKTMYGVGEDWLVTYDQLEPYYCEAEAELSVAGATDNPRIPRSKPYPLDAHPFSPGDRFFEKCFPAGSIVVSPQARPTRDVGDRPACCGSATCELCPVDSKYTTLNTHIPQLESMKNVRILTQRVALRIESDGHRKATRVLAMDNHGNECTIEAEIFVFAAHAIENAAILLRSSGIKMHPMVGKCLFDHPNFTVVCMLKGDAFPAYGQTVFTANCYEFYDGQFRSHRAAALGEIYNPGFFPIAHFVQKIAMQGPSGKELRRRVSVDYRRQLTINFLVEDLPDLRRSIRIGQKTGSLNFPQTEVFYTKPSNYVVEARKQIVERMKAIVSPLGIEELIATDLEDHAGHLLGTCRMGTPDKGVVDDQLRYHELDNLYILGGSAFPTYSPANPTLTIAALAIRLAEYLSK